MIATRVCSERADYAARRAAHWDAVAGRFEQRPWGSRSYQRQVQAIYRNVVSPGQRVLELGCGTGDLLAALKPEFGVGVDFSANHLDQARQRHRHLRFVLADVHDLPLDEPFDVIVLSDLVNDLWDVQAVLTGLRRLTTPRTRLVLNLYSRLWQVPLALATRLGLSVPVLRQNWLTVEDMAHLLNLAHFEPVRSWTEVLWPISTPIIGPICNRLLVKTWPFRHAALANFIVARPQMDRQPQPAPSVSVIVPARNEAGNIPAIFARVPKMGRRTELVFVEGHSRDNTAEVIQREMAAHPNRPCQFHRQTGVGKGDAVRLGFARATGDVLMILDADLTVPPEDLPRFYDALVSGKGELVNGVRLVYPMGERAMRPLNFLGNKFFSLAFSWLLGQPIKDTLCGTKALWKDCYLRIAANRSFFGDFDPFGDFDLLFGAAKQNLKLIDLPVRYRERTYGSTNIQRWRHGWLLLRMVALAARRIKFF